jgi:hypothetical protein
MTREFKIRLTFNDNGTADTLYIWAQTAREASDKAIAKYCEGIVDTVYCRATGITA